MPPDSVAWSQSCRRRGDASCTDTADTAEQSHFPQCTTARAPAATQCAVVRRLHSADIRYAHVALRAPRRARAARSLQQLHVPLPRLQPLGFLPDLPFAKSSIDRTLPAPHPHRAIGPVLVIFRTAPSPPITEAPGGPLCVLSVKYA